MYNDLLELCGYTAEEMTRETPRLEMAFGKLGITGADVAHAEAKIKKYLDVELRGLRKILGIWLKELTDMVLAAEDGKRVIYVSYPPIPQMVAALALTSEDVYCASPDIVLSNTLNLMFDKINPVLETAEKSGLAPGLAFCSYLQTRLGAVVQGIIPRPDLLIPSCFLCDLTPATDQLLHHFCGAPVAYIDNTIDEKGESWPNGINPRKVRYFAEELRNAVAAFNRVTGRELQDGEVRAAVGIADAMHATCGRIQALRRADPLPLGQNDYHLAQSLSCIGRGLREGPAVLDELLAELEARVAAGGGVVDKGAPRVMLVMVPHDPSLAGTIGELGLAACITAGATVKSDDCPHYEDLWDDVADAHMRSRGANYSSLAYITQLRESVRQADVQGIIFFRHYSCRQYSIFPQKAKELIEAETGLPVLLLDGDYCDFRNYNTRQMRTKLETFAEMVKAGGAQGRD